MNEELLKEVLSDEAFAKSLIEMETPEDVQTALKEKGVDLSIEDIKAIQNLLVNQEDGELSEDDLENVAGGVDVDKIITGVVDGICKLGDAVHKWTRRRW